MSAIPFDPPAFEIAGYATVRGLIPADDVLDLRAAGDSVARVAGRVAPGVREPTRIAPAFRRVARSGAVGGVARAALGGPGRLVRSILFDKTPGANWDVLWHQDVTIAVRKRFDAPGFGPWSVKEGVPHVQPPADVLERMVTLRLHLDDCGEENGPLLVVPGSHRRGVTDVGTLDPAACDRDSVPCTARAGDCLVMRPLLLHASRKALRPGHRRVLHLEFARGDLPCGLDWALGEP